MSLISFNGYSPEGKLSVFSITLSDIDGENTGRGDTTGIMVRERIRAGVYQIKVEYQMLTNAEKKALLKAISGESFSVTFSDEGETKEIEAYSGDRTSEMVSSDNWTVSFNIIQM